MSDVAPDIDLSIVRAICTRHKQSASPRKQNTIDLLLNTLQHMRENSAADFSVARVGRELELRGGPKTQSIRNQNGAYLREIISAYASAVQSPTRITAQAKTSVDRALALVNDHNVRYVLTLEVERLRKLKRENDDLRQALRHLSLHWDPSHNKKSGSAKPSECETDVEKSAALDISITPRLLRSLRQSIEPERLSSLGLREREDGAILDDRADVLMPPGFGEAIRTVLAFFTDRS